jgi:hypothetical protein
VIDQPPPRPFVPDAVKPVELHVVGLDPDASAKIMLPLVCTPAIPRHAPVPLLVKLKSATFLLLVGCRAAGKPVIFIDVALDVPVIPAESQRVT